MSFESASVREEENADYLAIAWEEIGSDEIQLGENRKTAAA